VASGHSRGGSSSQSCAPKKQLLLVRARYQRVEDGMCHPKPKWVHNTSDDGGRTICTLCT
jgi:hypothetical protein